MSGLNIGDKGRKVRANITWTDQRPVEHEHHAGEIGLVHGDKGTPDSEILGSEFRSAYIEGYRNGAWWRYARRENLSRIDLYDLIYEPRYPHAPPIWLA